MKSQLLRSAGCGILAAGLFPLCLAAQAAPQSPAAIPDSRCADLRWNWFEPIREASGFETARSKRWVTSSRTAESAVVERPWLGLSLPVSSIPTATPTRDSARSTKGNVSIPMRWAR